MSRASEDLLYARFKSVADERIDLKWYIRYAYYGFLFSLPFEMADVSVGGLLTLSKLLGYIFFAACALRNGPSALNGLRRRCGSSGSTW